MAGKFSDCTKHLRIYGFTPGRAMVFNPADLAIGDLEKSLFDSTLRDPKTISVKVGDDEEVPVIVDLVRTVQVVNDSVDTPSGRNVYHDTPAFYAEGQVPRSDVRVRMLVITAYGGPYVDDVIVQFINDNAPDDVIRLTRVT